jgi:sulfide:quinone oxidoreductase
MRRGQDFSRFLAVRDTVAVDREEFARLTAGEIDRLGLLARRLAPPGLDPDDLLQDTLERAWRSFDRLQGREAIGAWLRVIMVNRVRDQARRGRLVSFTALQDVSEPADLEIEDPVAVIAAAEQEDRLRSALRVLPHDELLAVVLVDGEGWRAAEVAAVCACSAGAVHKRVQRARERLARDLASVSGQRRSRPVSAACHAARGLASDYLDRRLGAEQRAEVEAHLRSCERCPPVLRVLQGIVAALGAGRGPLMPAGRLVALHAQVVTTAVRAVPVVAVIGAGPGGLAAARRLVQRSSGRIEVVLVTGKLTAIHLPSAAEVALGEAEPEAAEVPISLAGVRLLVGEAEIADDHGLLVDGEPVRVDAVIAAPGLSLDFDSVPTADRVVAAWDPRSAFLAANVLRAADSICVIVSELPYRCPPAPFGLATRLAARGHRVTVCTPEPSPLSGVGASAARFLEEACRAAGVDVATSFAPDFKAGLDGRVRSVTGEEIRFDAALVIPPHRRSSALRRLAGDGPLVPCGQDGRLGARLWVVGDARQTPLPRAAGVAVTQAVNAADAVLADLDIAAAPLIALPVPTCWLWTDERRAVRIAMSFPDGLPPEGQALVRIEGPSATLASQARAGVAEFAIQASG